jgi:hypothetical protein
MSLHACFNLSHIQQDNSHDSSNVMKFALNICLVFRYLYTLNKTCVGAKFDQTLEVIMTEVDPEKMKIFYQEYTSSAAEATKV